MVATVHEYLLRFSNIRSSPDLLPLHASPFPFFRDLIGGVNNYIPSGVIDLKFLHTKEINIEKLILCLLV